MDDIFLSSDSFLLHEGELYYYRRTRLFGQFPQVLVWRVTDQTVAWTEVGELADREGASPEDKTRRSR